VENTHTDEWFVHENGTLVDKPRKNKMHLHENGILVEKLNKKTQNKTIWKKF
jgi:hypothetical protein